MFRTMISFSCLKWDHVGTQLSCWGKGQLLLCCCVLSHSQSTLSLGSNLPPSANLLVHHLSWVLNLGRKFHQTCSPGAHSAKKSQTPITVLRHVEFLPSNIWKFKGKRCAHHYNTHCHVTDHVLADVRNLRHISRSRLIQNGSEFASYSVSSCILNRNSKAL